MPPTSQLHGKCRSLRSAHNRFSSFYKLENPLSNASGELLAQQLPARIVNVFGEAVLGQEQLVLAFGIAHEATAQMVFAAIGLECRCLLRGKNVNVLAFLGRSKATLDLDNPRCTAY